MKISIVMVDGGFRESFHIIDFLNDQTLPRDEYEIIWIEFYGEVREELKGKKGVNVAILGNPMGTEYHSSNCFNEGIRRSRGEIVVIPDADIIVDRGFLETVWREHSGCDKLVLYFHRWNELQKSHDKARSYTLEYLKEVTILTGAPNYGGCLTTRKKWLVEINGYDEDEVFSSGFHANGWDVYTRLNNLGLHVMWHPVQKLYHPWHPSTLAHSDRYSMQHSITRQRQLNLGTLPNKGMDPSREKAVKEVPVLPESPSGLLGRVRKLIGKRG